MQGRYRQTKPTKCGGTDDGESEHLIVPLKQGNQPKGTLWREGDAEFTELKEGQMAEAPTSRTVSTRLRQIASLARDAPTMAFSNLAHHIDLDLLREAHRRTRKDGAVGIDRQTAALYAENLEGNLQDLLERSKSGRYQAPPVRRVHIPKEKLGETRPIGIPTFEDKVLQRAVAMVLEAVYEQDFLDCSYGFRPGRSPHQAMDSLWKQVMDMGGCWVLDIDVKGFFDALDHKHLRSLLDRRVRDRGIRRLIGKWLNAGVMEEGRVHRATSGTPQGGVISPLLANVYLHEVLDVWFKVDVKPRLQGQAFMIRYADDSLMAFSNESDARRVLEVLPKRLARFGLELNERKTKLVYFRKPGGGGPGKPGTFDFLGFTFYWSKTLKGGWAVKQRTAKSRLRRAMKRISEWCRKHRHWSLPAQQRALSKQMSGHYAYYGRVGNMQSLVRFERLVANIWRKWLSRRSQKAYLTLEQFWRLRDRWPLPRPRIIHSGRAANP